MLNYIKVQTFDVQSNIIGFLVVLRADLALIDTIVHRPDVLDDQAPFVRPLVEINADPRVRSKRKQTDGQWMDFIRLLPGHL